MGINMGINVGISTGCRRRHPDTAGPRADKGSTVFPDSLAATAPLHRARRQPHRPAVFLRSLSLDCSYSLFLQFNFPNSYYYSLPFDSRLLRRVPLSGFDVVVAALGVILQSDPRECVRIPAKVLGAGGCAEVLLTGREQGRSPAR